MKLIVQIPCFNEEETLPVTFNDIPKKFEGIDEVEFLVIDDGSKDRTVEVARELGIHHIVSFTNNKGLAEAFSTGLDAALRLGADIIVNTDGDNQYVGKDIAKLIAPIVKGEADMVIGDRQIMTIPHFSFVKKILQRLGSWVVRQLAGTETPDTTSGFRAFSREAALRLNIISRYTYTLETVIQAGKKNIAMTHVPIGINGVLRPSRLFKSIPAYIKRSMATIFRIYALYEPLKIFFFVGITVFGTGFLISLRFVYLLLFRGEAGHIQSLLLAAILLIVGFLIIMFGLLADLISANRRLIEDTLYRVRKMELDEDKD
ncbi:glycosyltransferase family 2 protein [bacterium]|nr:glycosyltransferase family 2 protein [bacterium]